MVCVPLSCLFSRGLCSSVLILLSWSLSSLPVGRVSPLVVSVPLSLSLLRHVAFECLLFSKSEVWASPGVRPLHLFCPFEQLKLSCLLLKTRHLNWVKVNSGNQILLPRVCFYLCFVFIIVGCVSARDQPKVKRIKVFSGLSLLSTVAFWIPECVGVSEYLKTHGCSFGFVEAISASGGWSNRINPYLLIKLIYSIFKVRDSALGLFPKHIM